MISSLSMWPFSIPCAVIGLENRTTRQRTQTVSISTTVVTTKSKNVAKSNLLSVKDLSDWLGRHQVSGKCGGGGTGGGMTMKMLIINIKLYEVQLLRITPMQFYKEIFWKHASHYLLLKSIISLPWRTFSAKNNCFCHKCQNPHFNKNNACLEFPKSLSLGYLGFKKICLFWNKRTLESRVNVKVRLYIPRAL